VGGHYREATPLGYVELMRYADDTMLVFGREDDAQRVMRVLLLALAKFGLRLNPQKTPLVAFGKRTAWRVRSTQDSTRGRWTFSA
jgi:hypothetical protein